MNTLNWLQVAAWIATIIFASTAVVAALIARNHWKELRNANLATVKQAKANFLLELDHRFESYEMTKARDLLNDYCDSIMREVTAKHNLLDEANRTVKFQEAFADKLNELRREDRKNYTALMRFCGFFETVGLMVKLGYVELGDIVSLFKGPVLDIDRCYRKHIKSRQKETGVPEGFYENALFLVDRVKNLDRGS